METKRIKGYKINLVEKRDNNLEKVDIEFELVHKQTFKVLDRFFTIKNLNLKYDSKSNNDAPIIVLNTLKGPSITGFNLKQKHLKEIKNIIEGIEEIKELKDKLK